MLSALMCLNQARYGIAWGAVGAAAACLLEGLHYTGERSQFGVPIASFQLVQERLAEFASQVTLDHLMVHRLGRLKERGRATEVQISMAKRWTVRMALECARAVRGLHGAAGIVLDHSVGRHMCNLEAVSTYEGTHNAHTLILGEHLTGIPAFRAGSTEEVPNGEPVAVPR